MNTMILWLCLLLGDPCQTPEAEIAYIKQLTRETLIEAVVPHTHPRVQRVLWSVGARVEQWRSLVAGYFPSDQVDRALCIMAFESAGDPNAYHPAYGASGLMQVLSSWTDDYGVTRAELFIPEVNLSIAADLYRTGGWSHWNPWLRGECR